VALSARICEYQEIVHSSSAAHSDDAVHFGRQTGDSHNIVLPHRFPSQAQLMPL